MTSNAPSSATHNGINIIGVAGFLASLYACNFYSIYGISAVIIALVGYALPILLLEVIFLRTPWRDSVGLDFSRRNLSWNRVFTKLFGLYGSFGFVAFLYWLFPEYRDAFYTTYWEGLGVALPWVLMLAFPYMAFMDMVMKEPEDSYYRFGCFLSFDWQSLNFRQIGQHMLGWMVKGFFLPLMFTGINGNLAGVSGMNLTSFTSGFEGFFRSAVLICYTLDLMVGVVGYLMTIRLFDTHIRSTEPTLFGWWMCIMCYQPFHTVFLRIYLNYGGSEDNWLGWMHDYPNLEVVWGSVALIALIFYMSATINFGCRFSNLTHRGIITKGMYGITKHPAYICKNFHWWLVFTPFIAHGDFFDTLRSCLLLAGINVVYFMRARTEERHLSHDPKYVEYALWMNDHSIFRHLAKRIPFLRYKAPADWETYPKPYQGIK